MAEAVFTEEDRKNLRTIADELPKLRSLIEEFMETLEILSDEELMNSLKAGEKDVQEGRVISLRGLLKELGLHEQEILTSLHRRIPQKAEKPQPRRANQNYRRAKGIGKQPLHGKMLDRPTRRVSIASSRRIQSDL